MGRVDDLKTRQPTSPTSSVKWMRWRLDIILAIEDNLN